MPLATVEPSVDSHQPKLQAHGQLETHVETRPGYSAAALSRAASSGELRAPGGRLACHDLLLVYGSQARTV